jgi:hypothetical protein
MNIRSNSYFVAHCDTRCWHCGGPTRVLALAVSHDHETLDPDASPAWQYACVCALIFYVERLSGGVRRRLGEISPHYRLNRCPAIQKSYWANHCQRCGELLDDHQLHCELDGAFMPSSEIAASNIELQRVPESFEAAAAGYSFEPEFFEFLRRC